MHMAKSKMLTRKEALARFPHLTSFFDASNSVVLPVKIANMQLHGQGREYERRPWLIPNRVRQFEQPLGQR